MDITENLSTIEMTWGETAAAQAKGNGQRQMKVAARALTSIELFDAPLFSIRARKRIEKIFKNIFDVA